jgi:Phosphotransferase enzyme family
VSELLWTDRDWLEQASRWLRTTLGRRGIAVTGEIEQVRVRPWATALRLPTESGDVWFKASIPVLAQEAAVIQVLARHRADSTPEILAADPERGWMLLRDAGPPLEGLLGSAAYADRWQEALARYAELQIDLAEHVDELLEAGAVDRRLRTLPSLYEAVLLDRDALRIGLPDGLTEGQAEELRKLGPRLPAQAAELAAYGIPETIQHDDLSDADVRMRDGGYRFIDWGDACVSHPFFTMTVTLRVIAWRLGFALDATAPDLERFRDSYLEPWTGFAPRRELLAAFPLALRLGKLFRAFSYHLTVPNLPPAGRAEHADAVPAWLQIFLLDD